MCTLSFVMLSLGRCSAILVPTVCTATQSAIMKGECDMPTQYLPFSKAAHTARAFLAGCLIVPSCVLTLLAGGSSSSMPVVPFATGPAARATATALSMADRASSLSRVNLQQHHHLFQHMVCALVCGHMTFQPAILAAQALLRSQVNMQHDQQPYCFV